MNKILSLYAAYMKNNVIAYFKPLKRLFIISIIYNIFTILIIILFNQENLNDLMILVVGSVLEYYVVWGIVSVIMMAQTVDRELPLFDSEYIRKPGRYVQVNHVCIELRTPPVTDFYYGLIFAVVIYFGMFINFIIIKRELSSILFLNVLFCFCLSVLKECNRLEKDYENNLKKAKVIFMEYQGDKEKLKDNEMYYIYQVDCDTENLWYKELAEINNSQVEEIDEGGIK